MARGGSMFPSELFNDEGFRALSHRPQRLLMWLWLHPDLSGPGVIAIQAREWADATGDLTEESVGEDAKELRSEGWVDYGDGQLWIRPFMKLDGALKSQTVYVGATRVIKTVRSRRLKESIWEMFKNFPKPLTLVPVTDPDNPEEEKKIKRVIAMNASVENAYAELESHMATPGVRESLPIPHGYPMATPSRGRVEVEDGVDVEDVQPAPPSENGKAPPSPLRAEVVGLCTLGCDSPAGYGPNGSHCADCVERGVAF